MSSLPKRLLSAALAVGLLFGIRGFFREDGLFLGTAVLVFLSLLEFSHFFSAEIRRDAWFRWLFVLLGVLVYLASYLSPEDTLAGFWGASAALLIYLLLKIKTDGDREIVFRAQGLSVLGLFYCALCSSLTVQVLTLPSGAEWFLTLLAVVFFGDSFAFFAGSAFGKHKLAPSVSPKKTWEGAAGGIAGSILFGWLFSVWFLEGVTFFEIAGIAVVTGILGQFGDLFESLTKRVAGVKDSGKIMPGHGGVLDRIDGVLIGGPAFYFIVKTVYFPS